jgi:2-hydroxy-6-oxonona-2,4-dienedioate hydrolase
MSGTIWADFLGEPFSLAYHDAQGVRTRYVEAGEGPAVILLHGRGGHLENWIRNIIPLSRRFHVFALDMVGHGFSAKPEMKYTIARYASHIQAFMKGKGMRRASLIGQSLGGWVAGWMAHSCPELVEKLVLVNTNGFRPIPPEIVRKIREGSMAAVENVSRESMIARLRPLMLDPNMISDELVSVRMAIYRQPEMKRVMSCVMGAELEPERQKEFELTPERLHHITAPTLVTWTTHDALCSAEEADARRREIPLSEFHLLRDCAHWPQFEQAEEFNRVVTEFLSRQ